MSSSTSFRRSGWKPAFCMTDEEKPSRSRRGVDGWPSRLPSGLLVIRQDTREQTPWTWESCHSPVTVVKEKVRYGDYCLHHDETLATVERKSLVDFVKCSGQDRERFMVQVSKLSGGVENPLLIIESDYTMMEVGSGWRGRMTPEQVLACLHHVTTLVPTLLCRSRGEAERACLRHLRMSLKKRYDRCREFARYLQDHNGE